jgi:hypothetical protein
MKELGWEETGIFLNLDPKRPGLGGLDPLARLLLKQGPLISTVRTPDTGQVGNVPEGSLLFGEARHTRPGVMTLRYTLVQLPDGSKHPICLEERFRGPDVPPDGIMAPAAQAVFAKAKNWEEAW